MVSLYFIILFFCLSSILITWLIKRKSSSTDFWMVIGIIFSFVPFLNLYLTYFFISSSFKTKKTIKKSRFNRRYK